MQWKISVFLLVAMLCLAFTGAAAAEDVKCTWEKPCGTEVEQCDQETTFVLYENPEAQLIIQGGEWIYVDMDGESDISAGDIRLTGWHDEYTYNTKVMPGDDDVFIGGVSVLDANITYWDINENDKFDLYDPVYVDINNKGVVSNGDIRLTDVPPVDVYSLDNSNLGQKIMDAGSVNDANNQAWSLVNTSAGAGEQNDISEPLDTIGSGDIADLVGWVDADDNGEWSCADKLYINQPKGECWFDSTVTIGDIRLYIPPGDECVPECGTKVVQGDHDATYALMMHDATLSYFTEGPDEMYLDMDNSGEVTFGDVRLTSVSGTYDPNTKVGPSNKGDLGHSLTAMDQSSIRYADIDNLPGYSLGDPLYIDANNNMEIDAGDVRLNDVPVFDQEGIMAGEFGEAWSVVVGGINADADVNINANEDDLSDLGSVSTLLGYIDSDCSGDWTCPDKLYLQQMVDTNEVDTNPLNCYYPTNYNKFVTIGDHRLYVPVNDKESPFYDMEEWPECGTKVTLCNEDLTYALTELNVDTGFIDRDGNGLFNAENDAAYLDMDGSGNVTDGDVRLNNFTISGEPYEANTKVKAPHDKDLFFTKDLTNEGFSVSYGDRTLSFSPTEVVGWFDTDCSGSWTCVDALYLQDLDYCDANAIDGCYDNLAVTHGDFRLFIPPDMICDQNGGNNGDQCPYDLNEDGTINIDDVMMVVNAWGTSGEYDFTEDGTVNIDDVMVIVNNWGPCIV